MSKPTAFITGATSGIGEATARLLIKTHRIIICGRRDQKLKQLQKELNGESYPLCFDVRDQKAVQKAVAQLPEDWSQIDLLINNAGNAHGLDFIQDGDIQDWDDMMDINVKGLLYVSKAIIPQMVARKSGHIINIGSTAGREVYSKGNVYCASKHAVDAITKGMRIDLNEHNIKVSAVDPGLVETSFSEVRFKGDTSKAEKVYQGFSPLQAQDIAEAIEFVVSRPPHVTIGDILVLPTAQATSTIINKTAS